MYTKKNGRMTYKSNRRPNFKRSNTFVSKGRNISFMPESIKLHTTSINMDKDNIKPVGFDVDTLEGVSDHIPLVAKINF